MIGYPLCCDPKSTILFQKLKNLLLYQEPINNIRYMSLQGTVTSLQGTVTEGISDIDSLPSLLSFEANLFDFLLCNRIF